MTAQAHRSSAENSTTLKAKAIRHADFLLLLTLFAFFRFGSVLFFRPGGYTRDYSDLIFYQSRASWQDFGLLPYRDYWSEYPPLFAWFSLWVDALARRIPLWEDERLWYAAIFGLCMALAETVTLVCLYWLARRLHGEGALRVAWIYACLFLPVYFLGGWYDALPVATIFLGLAILVRWPGLLGALFAGAVTGVGGLLKLVPLATLAVVPLAIPRWPARLAAGIVALGIVVAGYAWAYLHGPLMTLTSIRSLTDRTGWATLYAWANGYTRLGKVLGGVFDPNATIAQYEAIFPERLFTVGWLLLGGLALVLLWRRRAAPHPPQTIVAFAALTYTVLLLAYTAWNPQYALYLLPFIALLWPNARGVGYALALTALTLVEHPIYHNLIGPDYAPIYRRLIDVDYRSLFLAIIVARTVVLLALALDLLTLLWPAWRRLRRLSPLLAAAAVLGIVLLLPQFGRAYVAGRLATSEARPLARFVNALPGDLPVMAQQLALGRQLRPLLDDPARLHLFGGRPGRIDPLPQLATGPFLYIRSGNDDPALVEAVEQQYGCPERQPLDRWELWFCNGMAAPLVARFAEGIELVAVTAPPRAADPLQVTLFWRATAPIPRDYTVFVHVVDATGAMAGQWDQQPAAGESPTTGWQPGALVVDEYQIPLNARGTVAPYRLLAGLYDAPTGERLAVAETARPVSDGRLEIATLEAR
ncbi:MAG: DUF2029 domain-containing protein [Caldilineaceae bacterium]|nr:DUF2029 domain-containing protein [Caldilineaceae bacterium]